MGNDVAYLYANVNDMVVKLIADPDSVRMKLCPTVNGELQETEGTLEADMTRTDINRLIRDLRRMRDRVFGADA